MVELSGLLASFAGFVLVMFWALRADTNDGRNGKTGFFAIWSPNAGEDEQDAAEDADQTGLKTPRQEAVPQPPVRAKARKRFLPSGSDTSHRSP